MPTTATDRAPAGAPSVPADLQPSTDHRAIYRRFRAQRFGELVGQEAIVTTLRRAVELDRLAHAYLFVGPRGTGKTSTARILAKAINCLNRGADGEPCDECGPCRSIRDGRALDVIEIDAASHGLVEDARDLVMRALTAPSEMRRRVYIIDEVHMLSTHAFNALLKLIEEPPPHVVFILATTDTHKVPATVISRTQRFDFRRLADALIAGKLERICAAEGAQAEPEALALIARLAEGGMRDAESLLDQVLSYAVGTLTPDIVRQAVGLADEEAVRGLLDAYLDGATGDALDRIGAMSDAGRDFAQVAAQLETEARRRLLASAAEPQRARRLAFALRAIAEAAGEGAREGRARLLLELLSVDAAEAPVAGAQRAAPRPASAPAAPAPAKHEPPAKRDAPANVPSAAAAPRAAATPRRATAASGERPRIEEIRAAWADVVDRATPVLKPLLRECRPVALDGAKLTLAFPEGRDFMRSRIAQRGPAIEQLLDEMFGGPFAVECVASNVELEPLTVQEALNAEADADGRALLEGVLRITGGELVDAPDVR